MARESDYYQYLKEVAVKNIAIVLAGGRGARMNSDIPKQYMDVAGKPLLYYSLAAFQQSFIDEIIIAVSYTHLTLPTN